MNSRIITFIRQLYKLPVTNNNSLALLQVQPLCAQTNNSDQNQQYSKWPIAGSMALVIGLTAPVSAQELADTDGDGIPGLVECPVPLGAVSSGAGTTSLMGDFSINDEPVINYIIHGEYPLSRRTSSEGLQVIWNQGQVRDTTWELELPAPIKGELTDVRVSASLPDTTVKIVNVSKNVTVTWAGGGSTVVSDPVGEIIDFNTGDIVSSGVVLQIPAGVRLSSSEWSLAIDFTPVSTFLTQFNFIAEAFGNPIFEGFGFSPIISCDSDGDGAPDIEDADSNNDGISDSDEGLQNSNGIADFAAADFLFETDTDGDGIVDRFDLDTFSDGLARLSSGEQFISSNLPDTDGNGTPDLQQATSVVVGPEGKFRTTLRGSGSTGPFGLILLGFL